MPYDVLWLDIEHTDGKRYFTWDENMFPDPIAMQKSLAAHGRRMVTIVDPHLKRDNNYYIHKEATQKGLYVKDKDGGDYDGWCWPGSSRSGRHASRMHVHPGCHTASRMSPPSTRLQLPGLHCAPRTAVVG